MIGTACVSSVNRSTHVDLTHNQKRHHYCDLHSSFDVRWFGLWDRTAGITLVIVDRKKNGVGLFFDMVTKFHTETVSKWTQCSHLLAEMVAVLP